MGSYDEIHTGDRCGQIKAFGKRYRDISLGDPVEIDEDPMNLLDRGHRIYSDGQVCVQGVGGGWLIVRDGIFVDWVDEPVDDLPCFDDAGRGVAHGLRWRDWMEANLDPGDCVHCEAIRELRSL